MITSVVATKVGMTQAWTTSGKRLPVTRLKAESQYIVSVAANQAVVAYGDRSIKRLTKPLQGIMKKAGITAGFKKLQGVKVSEGESVTTGHKISLSQELTVGDVVQVQGASRGRGYAGVVKRHGFQGGPATHGQSDRHRAPGSIGQRTTPGRVFKNKRMAGHMGTETKTVLGLIVVHIDAAHDEVWLSGPVPGSVSSIVTITKMGQTKPVELDAAASHLPVQPTETAAVSDEETAAEPTESSTEINQATETAGE